jgi:hypothetical protein
MTLLDGRWLVLLDVLLEACWSVPLSGGLTAQI